MPFYLIQEPSDEGSTPTLEGQFLDASGQPVGAGQLDLLWLTLYDSHTLVVINDRHHLDAMTLDGFSMNELGQFTWVLTPEDMPILDDKRSIETHLVMLEAEWTSGGAVRVAYLNIALPVRNLIVGGDLVVPQTISASDTMGVNTGEESGV